MNGLKADPVWRSACVALLNFTRREVVAADHRDHVAGRRLDANERAGHGRHLGEVALDRVCFLVDLLDLEGRDVTDLQAPLRGLAGELRVADVSFAM